MATPPTVTEQALRKLEDQLTLGICLDSYTEPKLLQCFHVYCKQCLERLVVRDPHGLFLHCPSCRRSTLLPTTGVAGLPTAFYLNNLFEVRDTLEKVKQPQKTQCEKCKKRVATSFCCNCGQFICSRCTETHQEWEEFSSHKVITLDQLEEDVAQLVPPKKKVMFCSKHPTKELDLYCETCEELVCCDCTVRIHRDHQYDLVMMPSRSTKMCLLQVCNQLNDRHSNEITTTVRHTVPANHRPAGNSCRQHPQNHLTVAGSTGGKEDSSLVS